MKEEKKNKKKTKEEKECKECKENKDCKECKEDKKKKGKKKAKNFNYFDALVSFTEYSCQAAELLDNILKDYNPSKLEEQLKQMHTIEHDADLAKHNMMNYLSKEFITPIDREDISKIAQEIDNVTDTVEDVLIQLYIFDVKSIREDALIFSRTVVDCCHALKTAMEDFHNFKRSKTIASNIISINNLEETGDQIYTKAIRTLYTTSADAVEILSWTKNFDSLEKCCDACEDVADLMESIIMKNS